MKFFEILSLHAHTIKEEFVTLRDRTKGRKSSFVQLEYPVVHD